MTKKTAFDLGGVIFQISNDVTINSLYGYNYVDTKI